MSKQIIKSKSSLTKSITQGVHTLLNTVVNMEKSGITDVSEQGSFIKKVNNKQDAHIRYGYRVKIGLDEYVNKKDNT
jgi:hypothetical protein